MSWKEYFNYTNAERKGIFALVIILVIILSALFFYNKISFIENELETSSYRIDKYISSLEEKSEAKKENNETKKVTLNPSFKFNPNTISKTKMREIGFSESQINNIFNYRRSGGKFFIPEDLKNIYTISDKEYEKLKDYIFIPQREYKKADKGFSKDEKTEPKSTAKEIISIELNSAQPSDLVNISGIGEVYSKRIIKFRDLLGGFYSVNQLYEVYGLDTALIERIKPNFKIDKSKIKKINLNEADNFDLKSHPYINRKSAYMLINQRKKSGKYKSFDEIESTKAFSKEEFLKVKNYISL